ncbi:MAG: cob(I)yrinic acid a,c-diamide adenosyltransferase [Lachnospiraceae bacterium]|nr:cob(I)yrinic acid a,c-diamide adenosyltransferase [Lachnospiraceae bacterium]
MIHIYCGDGKGKSTASIGLCVRATGNNIPVLFAQLLKDDTSGELKVLRSLSTVEILHSDKFFGFTWNMTEDEKKEHAEIFVRMLDKVEAWIDDKSKVIDNEAKSGDSQVKAMVILDEVIPAIECGLLQEDKLIKLLDKYDRSVVEFVLTGRNPSDSLKEKADYLSFIQAVKHPYKQGVLCRQGVEY